MSDLINEAIHSAQNAEVAFCKFISANDVGTTGGHQSGFYIPVSFCSAVFEEDIIKGNDYVRFVDIKWQGDFTTSSRFKYYGSKNECHLTRFGKNFPFKGDSNLGNLLIVSKVSHEYYEAYILNSDDDFENFFAALNITVNDTNKPIPKQKGVSAEELLLKCFDHYVKGVKSDFPSTIDLSKNARLCYNNCYGVTSEVILKKPDENLINWLNAEYQLFKVIENYLYSHIIQKPFGSVEELIVLANSILNRRKSRAGKSLEYHLEEVFREFKLRFTSQGITEDKKKPDFIFPSIEAYHNKNFNENRLTFLASKTTCKDRWRQVVSEADRIKTKHLFTLQQGISRNQLTEMYNQGVQLVVPSQYINSFPGEFRGRILTLETFITKTHALQ